jgi:hypothetical protein
MNVQTSKGTFNPAQDVVYVSGSFNGWGTVDILLDEDHDLIYTKTISISDSTISFKFRFRDVSGSIDVWESTPDRIYNVPTGGGTFEDYFDRDAGNVTSSIYRGLLHTPLGNALLTNNNNTSLSISNIGSSGNDGVRISLPDSAWSSVITASIDSNAVVSGNAVVLRKKYATVNGVPNLLVGTANQIQIGPNMWDFYVDDSPIGATSEELKVYRNDTLIYNYTLPGFREKNITKKNGSTIMGLPFRVGRILGDPREFSTAVYVDGFRVHDTWDVRRSAPFKFIPTGSIDTLFCDHIEVSTNGIPNLNIQPPFYAEFLLSGISKFTITDEVFRGVPKYPYIAAYAFVDWNMDGTPTYYNSFHYSRPWMGWEAPIADLNFNVDHSSFHYSTQQDFDLSSSIAGWGYSGNIDTYGNHEVCDNYSEPAYNWFYPYTHRNGNYIWYTAGVADWIRTTPQCQTVNIQESKGYPVYFGFVPHWWGGMRYVRIKVTRGMEFNFDGWVDIYDNDEQFLVAAGTDSIGMINLPYFQTGGYNFVQEKMPGYRLVTPSSLPYYHVNLTGSIPVNLTFENEYQGILPQSYVVSDTSSSTLDSMSTWTNPLPWPMVVARLNPYQVIFNGVFTDHYPDSINWSNGQYSIKPGGIPNYTSLEAWVYSARKKEKGDWGYLFPQDSVIVELNDSTRGVTIDFFQYGWSPGNQINLSVDSTNGQGNDTVVVPVRVAFPIGQSYTSTEVSFTGFQNQGLTFLSIDTVGTLLGQNGWLLEVNNTNSLLVIATAGAQSISGASILYKLRFLTSGASCTFVPISITRALFDTGTDSVKKIDGGVLILPTPNYGDADENSLIQAHDASMILQHLAHMVTLSCQGVANGDVSNNKTLSAWDASLILKYVVGLINHFPYTTTMAATGNIAMVANPAGPGDTITVPILLSNGSNILSFEGLITFDPSLLTFSRIQWSSSVGNFTIQSQAVNGELYFAGAGTAQNGSAGTFATLYFVSKQNPAQTQVKFKRLRWNEDQVMENVATATVLTGVEDNNVLPTEFALGQNYPNPFNPTTTISYAIPFDSKVVVNIFNTLGQEVALLKDEVVSAGNYEVNFNASHLSSGIYFYSITAQPLNGGNNFREAKKMILMK